MVPLYSGWLRCEDAEESADPDPGYCPLLNCLKQGQGGLKAE